jgi:hypothetical protein
MPSTRNAFRWIYVPPTAHLALCLIAMVGYVLPNLQFLGILWGLVTVADIPVSMVTVSLAFSHHGVLAGIWAAVAGTLWWYLLCLTAEFLAGKIRGSISLSRWAK